MLGNCDFYADHAAQFLTNEQITTNATESYVEFLPLGVVLAVMPWNFPYWQVFRFAAPTLMAGNTVVLKHASNVSRCALEIERIFAESGLPTGAFKTLLISGSAAEQLIADPYIAAVTLTGSGGAGIAVAGASGRNLKKAVLELGGSDPFTVLADADLDAAAQMAARSRFQNKGQSCIAAKRFIVERTVHDSFVEKFVAVAAKLRVGDPLDHATQAGPIVRDDQREVLHRQVRYSIGMGARLALGGEPMPGPEYFYEPTILSDVTPDMPVFQEETFGLAAAMIRVQDEDNAVVLANKRLSEKVG